MNIVEEYLKRLKSFKVEDIFKDVFDDKKIKDEIIRLNTQEQLFKKGINSESRKLSDIGGEYSPFTLQKHPEKVADRITLKDTGDFYRSFIVTVGNNFLLIDADPMKEDTNLFEEWGEDVLGLTEESMEILMVMILPRMRKSFLEWIMTA